MDKVDFRFLVDTLKPSPANEDIIRYAAKDCGALVKWVQPYHWKLVKGEKVIHVMTFSLTTLINGRSYMDNTIQKVRNQILNHFK